MTRGVTASLRSADIRKMRRRFNDVVGALRWAMDYIKCPVEMTAKEGELWDRRKDQILTFLDEL